MKRLSKKLVLARLDECSDRPEYKAECSAMKAADLLAHVKNVYGWEAKNWEETEETCVEQVAKVEAEAEQAKSDLAPKVLHKPAEEPKGIVGEIVKATKESIEEEAPEAAEEATEEPQIDPCEWDGSGPFPVLARIQRDCLDQEWRTLDQLIEVIEYTTEDARRKMNRWLGDVMRSNTAGLVCDRRRNEAKQFEYRFTQYDPAVASVRAVEMVKDELAPILGKLSLEHDSPVVAELNALFQKYSA